MILLKGIEMPPDEEGCEVIIRIQPDGTILDAHGVHLDATAKQWTPWLRECPFCGNEYISVISSIDKKSYWCKCEDCGVSTKTFNLADDAKEFWNRRA